ncbi:MAG: hypothetical protein RIT28_3760 [Pseudomonadota bacterium]
MRVTLVLPPLTQLNTPYPSAGVLARALRAQGVTVNLRDLGIELALRLFSGDGLAELFDRLTERDELPEPAWRALANRRRHEALIGPTIRFLQGHDRGVMTRILRGELPWGPRLAAARVEDFGRLGMEDQARHLGTLYLADLADLVAATEDPGFSLARYAHHLAAGPVTFDGLAARLQETTLIDAWLDALTDTLTDPVVGLSVPFPGNLYAALRIGRRLKARGALVLMGGGYVNTELREVDEPRLWDHVDALTYDDGEGPLLAILEHHAGGPDARHRTRTRDGLVNHPAPKRPFTPAADHDGLDLSLYLNLLDTLNPAHRLWADGRWNKVILAHGCYWKRCAFCDVGLDYIARYEAAEADSLAEIMVDEAQKTGFSGFHLVDEAAPPRGLRALALALLNKSAPLTYWGNIRFESTFTPDLCRLLAASGLVMVTGGLEVASDRLLGLMDKGVTVEQVARAAWAFRRAGVRVHAYLMYGFPTQTLQECVDSMELVRQLFAEGLLDSAFWHRFVLTRHSPVFQDPAKFGVTVRPLPKGAFNHNDREHIDPLSRVHDRFDGPLPAALDAWMRGKALQEPLQTWFDRPIPATTEPPDRVRSALTEVEPMGARLLWIGGEVLESDEGLVLHGQGEPVVIRGRAKPLQWLAEVIEASRPEEEDPLLVEDAVAAFPGDFKRFAAQWEQARKAGLLGI